MKVYGFCDYVEGASDSMGQFWVLDQLGYCFT